MAANGISTMANKQLKQEAKLAIAEAKRQGKVVAVDGTITGAVDPTKPYYINTIMGVRNDNTTSYVHADEPNLLNIHKAMEYDSAGQPILRTTASTFEGGINISNGSLTGVSYVEKFGRNDSLTANIETVWDGSSIYTYLSSDSNLYVTSDDGDDNPAGNGAKTVEVQGLDASYNLVTEEINIDDSASTASFIRVFRVLVQWQSCSC